MVWSLKNEQRKMEKLEREFKYLPHSQIEEKWGFYVTYAGYEFIPPNYSENLLKDHPSSHRSAWESGRVLHDYTVILTSHGSGVYEDKTVGKKSLTTGSCHMLFPGAWHRCHPMKKTGWHQYAVSFNGSYAQQLFNENFFSPNQPVLDIGNNYELLSHFKRTVMLVIEEPVGFQQMAATETMQILSRILACLKKESTEDIRELKIISEAKCIISDRYNQELKSHDLAKELKVGYSWFRKMFKHHTGLSPGQYHLALRIQTARELLSQTDLPVVSIAYKLGFSCPFYFSKMFKKKTGYSPSQFRASGVNRREK